MSISGNKKMLTQWTIIVIAGIALGGFIANQEKKVDSASVYNRASSMELLNRKDSLLDCSKDGLNTASMLTKKQLPRKPHD